MSKHPHELFRWGIIGSGGIAHAFARDLVLLNSHVIGAVGSRDAAKALNFAGKFPGADAYGSYDELVADPEIDGIYVATPHPMHVENTLLALNAGKPALCEKPFSVNAREARLMIDTARAKNLMLMEAMWTRFLPHIQKVREILAGGVLGEIFAVEADHGQRLADYNNPRHWLPELGGGALLDLGIYPVSFAHMVLGAPQKITATAAFTEKGVDAQTSAIFDYASGAQAVLTTTMSASTPCRAVISGALGKLEIDRTFYKPASMRVIMHDGTTTEYPRDYNGHGLREQALEFARCIKAGLAESPLLTLDETYAIMKSMDKIRALIGLKYPGE
ncbi:gfo/Idh/MocA family oxidoreductase [bacterium]|nr:MAG: gfo/Idh/MocA family oxidoreductase [bacterium]